MHLNDADLATLAPALPASLRHLNLGGAECRELQPLIAAVPRLPHLRTLVAYPNDVARNDDIPNNSDDASYDVRALEDLTEVLPDALQKLQLSSYADRIGVRGLLRVLSSGGEPSLDLSHETLFRPHSRAVALRKVCVNDTDSDFAEDDLHIATMSKAAAKRELAHYRSTADWFYNLNAPILVVISRLLARARAPALKVLNLSGHCRYHVRRGEPDGGVDDVGVAALVRAFDGGAAPLLQELNMESNSIDEGAAAVACALQRGRLPQLRSLNVANNCITNETLVRIAAALERATAPSLRELNLLANAFTVAAVKDLVGRVLVGRGDAISFCGHLEYNEDSPSRYTDGHWFGKLFEDKHCDGDGTSLVLIQASLGAAADEATRTKVAKMLEPR